MGLHAGDGGMGMGLGKGGIGSGDRMSPGRSPGMHPGVPGMHPMHPHQHHFGGHPNGYHGGTHSGTHGYRKSYGSASTSPARGGTSSSNGNHHHHTGSPNSLDRGDRSDRDRDRSSIEARASAIARAQLLGGAASNPMSFPVSFPPVYAAGHAGVYAPQSSAPFGAPSSPGGGSVVRRENPVNRSRIGSLSLSLASPVIIFIFEEIRADGRIFFFSKKVTPGDFFPVRLSAAHWGRQGRVRRSGAESGGQGQGGRDSVSSPLFTAALHSFLKCTLHVRAVPAAVS